MDFAVQIYEHFDKSIKELTLEVFYKSGTDTCLFWPPEIIAAAGILLANQKNEFSEKLAQFYLKDMIFEENHQDILSEEFKKLNHEEIWLKRVTQGYKGQTED